MLFGKEDGIFQEVKRNITGNCLSVAEEHELWVLLGKRVKEDRKCLATVIVEKIDEKKAALKLNATCKNISQFVLDKCFWKTEVGTMSAENLTSKIISCFIIEVREEFGLKDNEESMFMQLLQLGLNIMEDEGILKFKPDRMMYRKYVASKVSISYIRNPYSEEETEKIMEWAKAHPACVWRIRVYRGRW